MSNTFKGIVIKNSNTLSTIRPSGYQPSLTIEKKRTTQSQSKPKLYKPIYLHFNNLKPNTSYKIKLWYSSNHRGSAQMDFYHPYDSLYDASKYIKLEGDETSYKKLSKCSGMVLGIFNTYICSRNNNNHYQEWSSKSEAELNDLANLLLGINPNAVYPTPEEKEEKLNQLRQYVLQTEWDVLTDAEGKGHLLIKPAIWLQPMYRDNANGQGKSLVGTKPYRTKNQNDEIRNNGGHITFQFSIEENSLLNNDIYFSNNQLYVGSNVIQPNKESNSYIPSYIAVV